MSEDDKQEGTRLASRLLLWVPFCLLIYVLSIGPAAAVFGETPSPMMIAC